jgi:FixJ family two-component response regulator
VVQAAHPTVAVVDDEESVRTALRRLCASAGLGVEVYGSGDEFLADLPSHRPDCVILDLHMPLLDGLETQARMRRVAPFVPVIVITGYDTVESRQQAMAGGACGYFCKPVNGQVLLAAIAAAVGRPGAP